MALGTLTSLGMGSDLGLQNILDQLKEVEKAPITRKENQKTELRSELEAYNSLNAKLFSMKSSALDLSLESEFLKNKVAVDDEDIVTASVSDGVAQSSATIEVTEKAKYNSWQSTGVSGGNAVLYAAPETGVTSPDTAVTSEARTMTIQYGAAGSQENIDVDLAADMSLNEIAEAVNTSDANKDGDGERRVAASVLNNDGEYYIRLSDASGQASADSQVSVSDFDYVKADTTISIGLSDGSDPGYMTLAPGTTFSDTVDIINNSSDNPGVTASLINDGSSENPYKLTLTADQSGEDNRLQIGNLSMTQVTGADGESLNAAFKVNGIEYQRQKNQGLTGIISGVTLNLKNTGETGISVQNNTDPIRKNIIALVEGFNEIVSEINNAQTNENGEKTESENPLADSYTAKGIINDIKTLLGTTTANQGEYASLFDLGMSINKDGSISIDESTLDQALAANPDEVKSLFLGDSDEGIDGLGDIINNGLTRMVGSRGVVTSEINAAEEKMDRLEEEIEVATQRLDKRYEIMAQEFIRLDSYINQLNNEQQALTSMIDSVNNADKK